MPDLLITPRSALDLLHSDVGPELRDARMLAWLLDPRGEHGLGRAVLVRVSTCLTDYGRHDLSRLLASATPPPVEAEVRLRGSRVEVMVACGNREVVLAWRVEGRPEDADLAGFVSATCDVVGVGQGDGAFPPGLPVFVWADLLQTVETAGGQAAEPWNGLVQAFRQRLRAALGLEAPASAAPPPPAPLPVPTPPPARPTSPLAAPPILPPEPVVPAGTAAPGPATRRVGRPAGESRASLAERLLAEVPGLQRHVPGCEPPALRPRPVEEGTMLQGPDRRRTYLIHRTLERGSESNLFEVMIQGESSFPGYEEDVGIAAIEVPHEGSDVLERQRGVLATPDPAVVRMLAYEAGSTPFVLLERLALHPWVRFGVTDPSTAINTFANLLAALPRLHQRLDRILCGICPANLRLRVGGEPDGEEYVSRLATGAWEPVLVGLGDTVASGSAPPLIAGDPLFLAPESLPRGGSPGRYTRKTDVYALTLTFYQLLTGDAPYGRTDLNERQGAAWLTELLALKEKGTSPINGLLIHERFPPPVAEGILELFRAGLAPEVSQRRSPEDLLQLCRDKLGVVDRRPEIPAESYVWDDAPGLQVEQKRVPAGDLGKLYQE